VRICREEIRRGVTFAKGYEDCREKRYKKWLRSDESGQGRFLSLLICLPHHCIVGCQSGSEKRSDRRTRPIGRPDKSLAEQHGYARQTGRHGYKGGKKRIEEGYLFSPVKGTATSTRKAKKDHAYPGNRQMGRQSEVICRARNDGFEHLA
jgi:hypothetical protein